MRQKIVAGNWKMHKTLPQATDFINELLNKLPKTKAQLLIAAPYIHLPHLAQATIGTSVSIAAQNLHQATQGAYTGEISATMLKSISVTQSLIGHSERREYFGETDSLLAEKVTTALGNQIDIIFCVGEKLEERDADRHFETVAAQLQNGLFHIDKALWPSVTIAYEPVWAIGTGRTASPQQAQQMHQFIRETVRKQFGDNVAEDLSILYGGSVKPDNAAEIFSQPDVDGGLVGGASLQVGDFIKIAQAI